MDTITHSLVGALIWTVGRRRGPACGRLAKLVLPLLLTATLIASAATASPREPFSISRPDGGSWGPVVLAIVDHSRARPSGGYYCPPPEPGETEEDEAICLGADFVEGPATIVRYLSPRPDGWRDPGPRPRVRFIGGHAVRYVDAGRQLAILEQTDQGYLWRAWSTRVVELWACFPDAVVSSFRLTSRLPFQTRGGAANCVNVARLG